MSEILDDIENARKENDEIKGRNYEREIINSADFSMIDFQSVTFEGCRFIECDLSKASFYNCKFLHCDLSNCKLPDSYWKECEMSDCNCKGINLTKGTFKQTILKNNTLIYGLLSECTFDSCSVLTCNLSNALFSQVTLRHTKFSECRFICAEMFKTSLRGIDLSDCDISGIALSDTLYELRGAEVSYDQAVDLIGLLGIKVK